MISRSKANKMKDKLIAAAAIMICFQSSCLTLRGKENLVVKAKQESGRIDFEIINNGKEVLFIGDVEKCGATLKLVSSSIEGGIPVLPERSYPSWKYLVSVVPKNEETSSLIWTYKFSIRSKEIPNDRISKITLGIWLASESDFKKTTIESLQLRKFEVEIAK